LAHPLFPKRSLPMIDSRFDSRMCKQEGLQSSFLNAANFTE
jgi:hypothetical protein